MDKETYMAFKSYCWVIGTTSFRVKQLSYKNELQLSYLSELFLRNKEKPWRELQEKYYDLLVSKGFSGGTSKNKAKDSRELTSGLSDLGLVYKKTRHVTPVGDMLYSISKNDNFKSDNLLDISKDSYVYLLQFLKYQIWDDNIKIKPFVSLIYMLSELGSLTREEFTYLLPICMSVNDVLIITSEIKKRGNKGVNDILINKMMKMENYILALKRFLSTQNVTEDLISEIGMNRKSSSYDRPVYLIYSSLHKAFDLIQSGNYSGLKFEVENLKKAVLSINDNQSSVWRKYLSITKTKKIDDEYIENFLSLPLLKSKYEEEFRRNFFLVWHLNKWKRTLEDYYDLNKRYFSLTDIIRFKNQRFELTPLAQIFFKERIKKMIFDPFKPRDKYESFLTSVVPIEKIYPECLATKEELAKEVSLGVGHSITPDKLEEFYDEIQNKEFISLIDDKFPKEILLKLLDAFKNRDDNYIEQAITDEATPSTCFEYIIGIIWYELSGRKGLIKDYLKLSLDGNNLPKTHAQGGDSDLIFKYSQVPAFPKHDCLIEVTLATSTGQREMEWEPVTRHLEHHIVNVTRNKKDYTVFVAGELTKTAISTFRNMKTYEYYEPKTDVVAGTGLKIITLSCDDLKIILDKSINYSQLYLIFDSAYNSLRTGIDWYENMLKDKLEKY